MRVLRKYCRLSITRQNLISPAPNAGVTSELVVIEKQIPIDIKRVETVSEPRPRPAKYSLPNRPQNAALIMRYIGKNSIPMMGIIASFKMVTIVLKVSSTLSLSGALKNDSYVRFMPLCWSCSYFCIIFLKDSWEYSYFMNRFLLEPQLKGMLCNFPSLRLPDFRVTGVRGSVII